MTWQQPLWKVIPTSDLWQPPAQVSDHQPESWAYWAWEPWCKVLPPGHVSGCGFLLSSGSGQWCYVCVCVLSVALLPGWPGNNDKDVAGTPSRMVPLLLYLVGWCRQPTSLTTMQSVMLLLLGWIRGHINPNCICSHAASCSSCGSIFPLPQVPCSQPKVCHSIQSIPIPFTLPAAAAVYSSLITNCTVVIGWSPAAGLSIIYH